jgi:hypothetical protein
MSSSRRAAFLVPAAALIGAAAWWLRPPEPPAAETASPTARAAAPASRSPDLAKAPAIPHARTDSTPDLPPGPSIPSKNLEPPGSSAPVAGIVRSSVDGRPLEGIDVEAAVQLPQPRGSVESAVWSAVTDASGAFRSPPLPADRPLTFRFRAQGFVTQTLPLGSGSEREGIEIPLPPGGLIEGTVRDPDGRPVEGATVTTTLEMRFPVRSRRLPGGGSLQERGCEALSGPDGRFRIEGVRLDEAYPVRASHVGFLPAAPAVTRAGAAPIELRLRRGGGLEVRVLGPGGPVTGAEIWISQAGEGHRSAASVPERPFPVLEPGCYEMRVWAKGFLDRSLPVEVLEGRTTVSEVHVEPALALAGVVLDEASAPVSGAWVRARGMPGAFGRASTGDALSDESGRFRIAGLQPGAHQVTCEAEGLEEAKVSGVEPPDQRLEIRLTRHGRVRGQIVVPADFPAPAGVTILHPIRGSKSEHVRELRLDDGRFELDGVPIGKVRLRILVAGLPPMSREIEVPAGAVLDLGALVFGPGLPLHGQVVDPAGAPLPGATVKDADPNALFFDSVVTNDEGRFRLEALPVGEIELRVEAENYLATNQTAKVEQGASPLVVALRRGGLLKGETRHENGAAAPTRTVVIKGPNTPPRSLPSDKEGRFEVRLPAGTWRVTLEPRHLPPEMQRRDPIEVEVELREGEETPVVLKLPGPRPR